MLKKLMVIGFLSMMALTALSQDNGEKDNKGGYSGGTGFFSIGYGNHPTGKLENFLPQGSPGLSVHHLSTGGGGYFMINDLIIGGSGNGIKGESISTDSFEANTIGGTGFFNIGYRVASSKKLNFFPLLGIGGGGLGIEINETEALNPDDIRNNPGRTIEIDQSGLLFDFSLNMEWYPLGTGNENGYGGLLTGLKVGYVYQPFETEWEYDGNDINNPPDYNFSGVYARLVIGFGGASQGN